MARMFVMSDNLTATVEIRRTDEGECVVFCVGCSTGSDNGVDLVADTHERFTLADAELVAVIHADSCTRCADRDCRTEGRHDAGHRCRKVA